MHANNDAHCIQAVQPSYANTPPLVIHKNTHTLREKVFISQKPHMIRIQKHPICVFKDLNFRSDAQFVSDQPQVVSSKSMSNKPTDGLIKWTVRD